MAAIKPHLAEDGENTELQEDYWACASEGLDGLGRAEQPDVLCPTPQAVVDQSHASLLTVAYTRKTVVDQLRGRTITPGYKGGKVVLFIDESIPGPAWNPFSDVESTSLLSWTTKMGAPSFSLPAGAKEMGGSCPGAAAGQSIVSDNDRRKQAKVLLPILEAPQVELAKAICEFCYAEGGQYATGSVQYHQMVRFAWTRRALFYDIEDRELPRGSDMADSAFVRVMIDAIERADFKINAEPAHWGTQRFFRLHDSGDIFSTRYLAAWKTIADHYHPDNHDDPITFWAPTRMWATGRKFIDYVNEINGQPDTNLVLRPSAYHIDQHGPPDLGPGWAGASVVYDKRQKGQAEGVTFDWDCKAYAVEKGPSCRGAKNPKNQTGCRVCWKHPELRVNYTLHL